MKDVLKAFDRFLFQRGLVFDMTVIGGAALLMQDIIDRATQDVDCLCPDIPPHIRQAAASFARNYQGPGSPLVEDWLNNGPAALQDVLPNGWDNHLILLHEGEALRVTTLDRFHLLCTKLFAFCDRQQDEADCIAMAPSMDELNRILPWLEKQDGHPGWPEHVRTSLQSLGRRCGHGE